MDRWTGTRISRPAAGYLLWVELPPGGDGEEVCRQAAARGIAVLPGVLFSPARRYRRHLRVSCGYPFTADLEAAVKSLGELAHAVVGEREE